MELTTVCRCGGEFPAPNKNLMFRFKENFHKVRPEKWQRSYNALPREVKEITLKVVSCVRCFDTSLFENGDFL